MTAGDTVALVPDPRKGDDVRCGPTYRIPECGGQESV